ncbi:hypothetical protein SAMN05443247_07616 [Bradyrhizobium erythrophlei]|nr:hypothetical protein SAMN05443247_07616 [Bradyrhizobium erythrophlei]
MPTDHSKFRHIAGPKAVAIAAQVDGTVSADVLCRSGFPYPTAIALAAIIAAGSGGAKEIEALHRLGFSASDAAAIVAASNVRGAH